MYDECKRLCRCQDGKIKNCYRIRKEFSNMTLQERERYINTYKEVSTSTHMFRAYSGYCKHHAKYFHKGIHKDNQFFPWHRK